MTAVTKIQTATEIQAGDVEAMTASWQDLLRRPIRDEAERHEIAIAVAGLSKPPRREFVLGRVAALLSQYYAADLPQSMVRIMADDWAEELAEYPEWAITKAVRWWKSEANPERKRKPLEGDISARAKREMSLVRVAERALRKYAEGVAPFKVDDTPRTPVDPKVANAILAEVGFTPRKFGGAA